MASDPLSFFAAGSDDSSDSDDDEAKEKSAETKPTVSPAINKPKLLPPPMVAIAGAKRPEFTIDPLKKGVDWDRLTKKAPVLPEKEFKPWENRLPSVDSSVKTKQGSSESTLAQHVPGGSSLNFAQPCPRSGSAMEFVDQALKWSNMYQNLDKDGHLKRTRPEDIGGEEGMLYTDLEAEKVAYGGAKKKKVANQTSSFRTKEAKKRTMGLANRDKMFVEEEKRVLRQQLDKNY